MRRRPALDDAVGAHALQFVDRHEVALAAAVREHAAREDDDGAEGDAEDEEEVVFDGRLGFGCR